MPRETFEDFRNSYKEPSYSEFLKNKIVNIPTWEDAEYWHQALSSDGPMSEQEYADYANAVDPNNLFVKDTEKMRRYRAMTVFAWYIKGWVNYFRNWTTTFAQYKEIHFENAYNAWLYNQEGLYW